MKISKKQIIALVFFSIIGSVMAISHGVFFDLEVSEIGRLSSGGVIMTAVIVFLSLILIEWVFDMDNRHEIQNLSDEIEEIKNKLK